MTTLMEPQTTRWVRRTAERLLGPARIWRTLPAEAGGSQLLITAEVGGLKCLLKPTAVWDPELMRAAEMLVRPGDRVWDIGANVGLFSVVSAYHAGAAGEVIAVEADAQAVALLMKTADRQPPGRAPITVVPYAIADHAGEVSFAIARRARASNAIEGFGASQTGGVREVRHVPCVTADELLETNGPPQVVKIDVEGAELRVLAGATRVLTTARPRLYIEVDGHHAETVAHVLRGFRYRLHDGASFDPDNPGPELTTCTFNTVAIPSEQI